MILYRVIIGHNVLTDVNMINKNFTFFNRVKSNSGAIEVIMYRRVNGHDVVLTDANMHIANTATRGDLQ